MATRRLARSRRRALRPRPSGAAPRVRRASRRRVPPRWRPWLGALGGRARASRRSPTLGPALTGEGPPLAAYARMTRRREGAGRRRGRAADSVHRGSKRGSAPARRSRSTNLWSYPISPGRADLRYRAVWIPDTLRTSRRGGGASSRARTFASSRVARRQPHGQVADAKHGALPETLPVQIGAMLGVRSSLKILGRGCALVCSRWRASAAAAGPQMRRRRRS